MKVSRILDPRRIGPGEFRLLDKLEARFGSKLTTTDLLFAVSFREAFRRGVLPAKLKEADLPPATWQRVRKILAKAPGLEAALEMPLHFLHTSAKARAAGKGAAP